MAPFEIILFVAFCAIVIGYVVLHKTAKPGVRGEADGADLGKHDNDYPGFDGTADGGGGGD